MVSPHVSTVHSPIPNRARSDEADVATLDELWSARGITTETYQSGGSPPHLGIRGAGGPTTSIDLLADPRGYSISAVSECADGDASEMQGDGE